MNNYYYYTQNITPKEIKKIEDSRDQWVRNPATHSRKAALLSLEIRMIRLLLDEMAYTLDLLVDDSNNNRNWFKVKEVLDKYEKYKRTETDNGVVDSQKQRTGESNIHNEDRTQYFKRED